MAIGNSSDSWGWLARTFHWVMAILILGMLAFGFYLAFAFGPGDITKLDLVQTHKSFGFVVFVLACLRLIWRAVQPSPELPAATPAALRRTASASHLLLYALMFAMPLSGWLAASASPLNDPDAYPMQIRNMVFGLFEMPDPYPQGSYELSGLFMAIHFWCALALCGVLALHVAGAMKHALVDRDGVFRRMVRG